MLEVVRTEQMENLECMEVEAVEVENEAEDTMANMIAEAMANAKYKVGDKVYYLDMQGVEAVGTIGEVTHTEIYSWNDKIVPLYLISNYGYLRTEEEILDLYDKNYFNTERARCPYCILNKMELLSSFSY